MKSFGKIVLVSFCVFFFSWIFVYQTGINKLSIQSEDALPAMFIPVTVLKEKTLYVDTYYEMLRQAYPHPDDKSYEKGLTPFYLRSINGHYISAFTLMSGIISIPVYFFPVLLGMHITFGNLAILSHISASLIVALSGGFLYLLLRSSFSLDEKKAKLLTFVYLFGSINFALNSQALWQHGTVQLFIILALTFLYKQKWFFMSLMLGLTVLARPTVLILVFFLVLLALSRKPNLAKVFLGFLPCLLFFLWYNQVYYVSLANQGYASQVFTEWKSHFLEGFSGLWISPSKGILIYSPVFVFSLIGFWLASKDWRKNVEYVLFFCAAVLYTLVLGKWKHWYGGYSFGYRMASDIIPFLILLMVPFVKSKLFEKYKKVFWGLFGFSVLVQIFGMFFFDGIWHAAYDRGFVDTAWLWSVKNSEFMFNIRRILVKFSVLERACPQCLPKS